MARQFHNAAPRADASAPQTPADVNREFARRLNAMMIERGWNQSELARQAAHHMPEGKDFGRDCVSGYIRGLNVPQPVRLKALCAALGCDPDDLLPSRGVPSVDTRRPEIEMRALPGGKAHLRIDKAVSLKLALKIMSMIEDAGEGDADA